MRLSDSHLEDPRFDRELQDEQAARDKWETAILKHIQGTLTNTGEVARLVTEFPDTVAKLIVPMMTDDYEDHVPEFRKGIRRLAEIIADSETMSWEAFLPEKEIER